MFSEDILNIFHLLPNLRLMISKVLNKKAAGEDEKLQICLLPFFSELTAAP